MYNLNCFRIGSGISNKFLQSLDSRIEGALSLKIGIPAEFLAMRQRLKFRLEEKFWREGHKTNYPTPHKPAAWLPRSPSFNRIPSPN